MMLNKNWYRDVRKVKVISMTKYWSSIAKRAEPYVPGLQINEPDMIKLNTNENPYAPSPKVWEAIQKEAGPNLRLYPSPTGDELRDTIGSRYGLSADEVFIGNGSDEVLAFSFMAFFEPDQQIRYPAITYSFYPVYAKIFDIPYEEVLVHEDFSLPIEAFYNSTGGVILPNPNAPTSLYIELEQIEAIVKNNPHQVVIIDEAYIDFATQSAAALIHKYDNLLVIQTTSKSRSLAGLRVGYALGNKSLINALIRVKDSFNSYTIDRLALAGAQAAFEDEDYFKEITEKIIVTRENVIIRMRALNFHVLPSKANFVFVSHPDFQAEYLYTALRKAGILTRHFQQDLIHNYLRITVGTEEEMDQFIEKLQLIMQHGTK